MNDDSRSELEKLARTINDNAGFQMRVAADDLGTKIGMVLVGAFVLFIAYVMLAPDFSPSRPAPVRVRQPSTYTQPQNQPMREITKEEFWQYWTVFCNQANSKGYPGTRWYKGQWQNNQDFQQARALWLQFLAERNLRQPPPGSAAYK